MGKTGRFDLRDLRDSGAQMPNERRSYGTRNIPAAYLGQAQAANGENKPMLDDHGILVVEDDAVMREELLIPALRESGFKNVTGVGSAMETYRAVLTRRFSLFLLDIGLPDESGFSLTQNLRAATDAGIVMLTSGRPSKAQQAQWLEDGADAYLTKPIDTDLLTATVRSVLRRQTTVKPVASTVAAAASASRKWRLDTEGWTLVSPRGVPVHLTRNERVLIEPLMARMGNVVSREDLISRFTHDVHDFDPHRLEVIIHRLRHKACKVTGENFPLRAVRGSGYVLTSR